MFDIEKFWLNKFGRGVNFFEDMDKRFYDNMKEYYYRMEKLKKIIAKTRKNRKGKR